jgi:hypothetical protein
MVDEKKFNNIDTKLKKVENLKIYYKKKKKKKTFLVILEMRSRKSSIADTSANYFGANQVILKLLRD